MPGPRPLPTDSNPFMTISRQRLLAVLLMGLAWTAAPAQVPGPVPPVPAPPQGPPPGAPELLGLSLDSIAANVQRPIGAPTAAPRTHGDLDLKGRKFYLAEYQVLVEVEGEIDMPATEGQVLGTPVDGRGARVAWKSSPDIEAIQVLVDRSWADLQARIRSAGVEVSTAKELLGVTPRVFTADLEASKPYAPVKLEVTQGRTLHRYWVFAPTGMQIVPRTVAGLNPGNVMARVTHLSQHIEGLSLGIALHLSAQDAAGPRPSAFAAGALPAAVASTAQSPWMELVSTPPVPLIDAHVQSASVRLSEALTLKPHFGRLYAAPAEPAVARASRPRVNPVDAALSLGRFIGLVDEDLPRINAILELDGPGLSRGLLFGVAAANQAIVEALVAAR
jgi:hypothetical protein